MDERGNVVTTVDEQHPASFGEALGQELRWVHGKIRHDLEVIQQLADRVLAGISPAEIQAEIAAMQTNSPVWRLRVNCLYYCRVVHTHHRLEDRQLFPALRSSNPALGPVVDKLEADHARVSNHLDGVETAADALAAGDSAGARQRVVDALRELTEHLLVHLSFEEEAIIPTMQGWDRWPRVAHG
jgi:hypothetical protein